MFDSCKTAAAHDSSLLASLRPFLLLSFLSSSLHPSLYSYLFLHTLFLHCFFSSIRCYRILSSCLSVCAFFLSPLLSFPPSLILSISPSILSLSSLFPLLFSSLLSYPFLLSLCLCFLSSPLSLSLSLFLSISPSVPSLSSLCLLFFYAVIISSLHVSVFAFRLSLPLSLSLCLSFYSYLFLHTLSSFIVSSRLFAVIISFPLVSLSLLSFSSPPFFSQSLYLSLSPSIPSLPSLVISSSTSSSTLALLYPFF